MKWTSKEMVDLMDLAEDGKCDKDCEHCPIFLPDRDECYVIANKKWQLWARKKSMQFQDYMKGIKQ